MFEITDGDQGFAFERDHYRAALIHSGGSQVNDSAIGLRFGYFGCKDLRIHRKSVSAVSSGWEPEINVSKMCDRLFRNIVNGKAQCEIEQHQGRNDAIAKAQLLSEPPAGIQGI